MRGLEEIKAANANPRAYRDTEEHFGVDPARNRRPHTTEQADTQVRMSDDFDRLDFALLSTLGIGLPNIGSRKTDDDLLEDALISLGLAPPRRRPASAPKKLRAIDEFLTALILIDLLTRDVGHVTKTATSGDETGGIEPAEKTVHPKPPFDAFWDRLNAKRVAAGEGVADYALAREEFTGGPTPLGAITFIGEDWNGLRSVPAAPVTYLGGSRPAYHGERRIENADGSFSWKKVENSNGFPIVYACPEAALVAAREGAVTLQKAG